MVAIDDTFSQYSRTVEYYGRYRPRYPQTLIEWLKAECAFTPLQVVADIGSGTGQMTELFVKHGNPVYAIEPNADMRAVAERELDTYPRLTSLSATAEETTLPDHSVHLITVGNAFHWFKHDQVQKEFRRILIARGWVVLAWNLERNNGSPFASAFEEFWKKHIDPAARFEGFRARNHPDYIFQFFDGDHFKEKSLDNYQVCDFEALKGLALSFLKAPQADDPRHPAMLAELKEIFDRNQINGGVTLEYDTAIYYGQLLA
ncbi:MAG TPA: class I SAM-dependent methyltransferase [Anaerolineales bacterium]|jgi:ubiquinone/menaquinone biosynthesis C-methylase UbiE|nr:class I SAM-dependent methyltransferase [Anaerolineales bacterium]